MNKIYSKIIFTILINSILVRNAFAAASDPAPSICDLEGVILNLISISGTLLGFAFFAMVVYGGIRYLFSGGDPKAVQAAKGTLTWAIIGLAIYALSFTILLLIKSFTGVDVTNFKLC
jgi:hypothetical protein